MNCLFPKIFKEMIDDSMKIGYIEALKHNIIDP